MSREAALAFLERLTRSNKWPQDPERLYLRELNTWRAIYELDRDRFKQVADWKDPRRAYRIDPLGERIADAWAAYLFNEDPRLIPSNEQDGQNLANLYRDGVGGTSELERAASIGVAEGEIWARIFKDELVAPTPLLDWTSRRQVVPLWVGSRLAAAAVWTELDKPKDARKEEVHRHFEIHAPGVVLNVLYVGKAQELGRRVDLEAHPDLAGVDEWWETGLNGLAVARIPNRLRGDRTRGRSDYAGILDYLLDLNEACTIGSSNMRLTARKRAVLSAAYAQQTGPRNDLELTPEEDIDGVGRGTPRATFDAAEEVLIEDPVNTELGKEGASPFRILEYSFDAAPLIAWKRELVESAITRCGLMAQYIGAGTSTADGYAISGTALRLRLIPTDTVGRAKARYWLSAFPRILSAMAQLDANPRPEVGFGRPWTDAATPPTVERRPGIPVDEVEEAQKHQARRAAGIESIYQAVRETRTDWTEEQVNEEVDRIRADGEAAGGGTGGLF